VAGLASGSGPVTFGLDEVKRLPRVEMTTEFKCIEGWSVIVHWTGARFTDFMTAYPPETQSGDDFSLAKPEDLPPYVSLATPDGQYYVGLDMESMLHPQTLLAYEINGKPLSQKHGAPLRLVTTVKYGVKSLKRIGSIRYSVVRPADYWAEQGYDWYIGL
jgi:DMSO/TMAO reductase YedYZ molybdopterin-dependent catalytic subunit